MARTKETRVRWNPDEKRRLVEAGRRAVAESPMKPLQALEVAQRVLPKARRRHVSYSGKVAWFVKGIANGAPPSPTKVKGTAAASTRTSERAGPLPVAGRAHVLGQVKAALVALAVEVLEEALEQVRSRARTNVKQSSRATAGRKAKRAKRR